MTQHSEEAIAPGVILVIRADEPEHALTAARGAVLAGIDAVEITYSVPDAPSVIEQLRDSAVPIGAGTVLEPEQVDRAVAAGARFVVAPDTFAPVIGRARELGVAVMSGAFTPTEVQSAWRLGVSAVKVFPVSAGGPGYIRELQGPLPHVRYIASGGLDAESAGYLLEHGADAVCLGISMLRMEDLRRGDIPAAQQSMEEFLRELDRHREAARLRNRAQAVTG